MLKKYWALNSKFVIMSSLFMILSLVCVVLHYTECYCLSYCSPKGLFYQWHHNIEQSTGFDTLLSALIGALISVLITCCSFVFVALQLASIQFSPRIIRYFSKADYFTHFFVVAFTTTVLICSFALLFGSNNDKFLALLLTGYLLTIVLPSFLLHLANNINASHITNHIAEQTILTLKAKYQIQTELQSPHVLTRESGYVQEIDYKKLIRSVKKYHQQGIVFKAFLQPKIGDFVYTDGILILIESPQPLSKSILKELGSCFKVDTYRTITNDIYFSIRQLVDMAIKAISPAVNDPTTAINSIHHLTDVMCQISQSDFNQKEIQEGLEKEHIYLNTYAFTFSRFLDATFDQIYQWGKSDYIIVDSLLKALEQILKQLQQKEQMISLQKQLQDMELDYLFEPVDPLHPITLNEHREVLQKHINHLKTELHQKMNYNAQQ